MTQNTSESKRAFSDSHLSALKQGAKRRSDAQIVGEWVRATNPLLFGQLLIEAIRPTSALLNSGVLSHEAPIVEHPSQPEARVNAVEDLPSYRKPPPQLNIR